MYELSTTGMPKLPENYRWKVEKRFVLSDDEGDDGGYEPYRAYYRTQVREGYTVIVEAVTTVYRTLAMTPGEYPSDTLERAKRISPDLRDAKWVYKTVTRQPSFVDVLFGRNSIVEVAHLSYAEDTWHGEMSAPAKESTAVSILAAAESLMVQLEQKNRQAGLDATFVGTYPPKKLDGTPIVL